MAAGAWATLTVKDVHVVTISWLAMSMCYPVSASWFCRAVAVAFLSLLKAFNYWSACGLITPRCLVARVVYAKLPINPRPIL